MGIVPSPEESLSDSSFKFVALDAIEADLRFSTGRLPFELTGTAGTMFVDLAASTGRVVADAPATGFADGIGFLFEVKVRFLIEVDKATGIKKRYAKSKQKLGSDRVKVEKSTSRRPKGLSSERPKSLSSQSMGQKLTRKSAHHCDETIPYGNLTQPSR